MTDSVIGQKSFKFLVRSQDVLLNIGGQALPDLQAELALRNTGKLIVINLTFSGAAKAAPEITNNVEKLIDTCL